MPIRVARGLFVKSAGPRSTELDKPIALESGLEIAL